MLVHWKEEDKSCRAKPRQPSSHHQYDDYGGVKVQALTTPTSYCYLHTLETIMRVYLCSHQFSFRAVEIFIRVAITSP